MGYTVKLKIAIGLILILCMIGGGVLIARQRAAPSAVMDDLERSLETSRHARLLASIAESDATLDEFTTDGCSGGLSSAWIELSGLIPEFAQTHGAVPPWQSCCVAHDQRYHAGGLGLSVAGESFEQRKQADLELLRCVVDAGMSRASELRDLYGLSESQVRAVYEVIAQSMYRAVRLGGIPCTSQPWRWGYGWPACSSAGAESEE